MRKALRTTVTGLGLAALALAAVVAVRLSERPTEALAAPAATTTTTTTTTTEARSYAAYPDYDERDWAAEIREREVSLAARCAKGYVQGPSCDRVAHVEVAADGDWCSATLLGVADRTYGWGADIRLKRIREAKAEMLDLGCDAHMDVDAAIDRVRENPAAVMFEGAR